jgi:ABC-type transport system involved in cytochrome bd biosynthesis fused ATPase/permease subunit
MTEQLFVEPTALIFIQSRAATHHPLIDEYAEMMQAGIQFDAASLEQVVLGATVGPTGLEPVTAPLAGLVHIAIGGSSGWGKSMMLRAPAFQLMLAPEAC